eukprot:6188996-Pleurochrysis_carterae.AAC.3
MRVALNSKTNCAKSKQTAVLASGCSTAYFKSGWSTTATCTAYEESRRLVQTAKATRSIFQCINRCACGLSRSQRPIHFLSKLKTGPIGALQEE